MLVDADAKRKKRRRQVVEGVAVLAVVWIATQYVVGKYRDPSRMSVVQALAMDMGGTRPPEGLTPVATEKVALGPLADEVVYTGTAVAYDEVDVFPRTAGWIQSLLVYPGEKVKKGQLVAKLDTAELDSRLREAAADEKAAAVEKQIAASELLEAEKEVEVAKAEVEEVKALVRRAEADAEYWRGELSRVQMLYERGAVSKQEYDQAVAEMEKSDGMVAEAQAKVMAAKRMLEVKEVTRTRLHHHTKHTNAMVEAKKAMRTTAAIVRNYSDVLAPLSGFVTKRWVSQGTLVQPGTPIVRVAQVSPIRIQANVAEVDMPGIQVGDTVIVSGKDEEKKEVRGKVSSVFPASDPSSRTAVVEAVLPNEGLSFLPGAYVRVVLIKQVRTALSVPIESLVEKEGKGAVWVIRRGGKEKTIYQCPMHPEVVSDRPGIDPDPACRMRLVPRKVGGGPTAHLVEVTTGLRTAKRVEIVSGLREGDEVVVTGQKNLKEGAAIFPTTWGKEGPDRLPAMAGPGGAGSKSRKERDPHLRNGRGH